MRQPPAIRHGRRGVRDPREDDGTVACPRCGRAAVWSALVRTGVLEGAALESLLAVPPDGWFVDVRACAGCGVALARKARVEVARVEPT